MTRYVAIPQKAWVSATHTPEYRPTCEVIVPDDGPKPTGLLDASGTPLFRMNESIQIGFVGKI